MLLMVHLRIPTPDKGQSSISIRSLYFKKDERRVIFDPGQGKWIESFFPGYHFISLRDATDILTRNGHAPAEITDIFLTHLHFDHCGYFCSGG